MGSIQTAAASIAPGRDSKQEPLGPRDSQHNTVDAESLARLDWGWNPTQATFRPAQSSCCVLLAVLPRL